MPGDRRRHPLIATVLVGSLCAGTTKAQVAMPAPSGSKEANQGVYVRDSAVAAERLALGERMERLREWDKAADVFQEILEKYADRVVQSTAPGHAYQYSSVAVAVQQRLAKWPDDGLRAYRNRFGPQAAEVLAGAARDDFATLNAVYQRYFVTDAGKAAGLRLVDLYLENGEFAAAAWLGDRLLQWHPTIAPEKPKLLYRVAVACHLSGDKDRARARLEELKSTAADATGTVRGRDVNLADSLAKDLGQSLSLAQTQSADSWPVFLGDATRGRVSNGRGRAGARPFSSIELAKAPAMAGIPQEIRQSLESAETLDREKGLNIGVIPAVDHGDLFFQDGVRVYAVNLDTGTPLPGWASTYTGTGYFSSNAALAPLARRQQYTTTVTDKEVLAVVGQSGRVIQFPGQPSMSQGETRLVCLDRVTGKERWSRTPKDFPDQGNVRSLSLGGSPLVIGDNVYVCGTGGKSPQFDDCYVFCLDRSTGAHKWSAYVCSAATGQVLWGGDTGPVGDVVCSPAYSSGRLYVLSNLGAVAALDAYSGSIVWLDTYERDSVEDPRLMRFGGVPAANQLPRPWAYNPAIVSDGRVYSLPSDGKHLCVYDAGSGDLLKKVTLSDVDNADTIIGVQGNKIVLSSDTMVYALNWEAYDPANFKPLPPQVAWHTPSFTSKSPVRGRGFITADSVFVPTKERLNRIGLSSGKIEEVYPPFSRGPWEDPEGPGNVVVTEDKVVLAGSNRVSVYTDLAVARARLDKDVAAAPTDPELRLRYADMLFVAGDLKGAMAKLDEAIAILGGDKGLAAGPARDRAFLTALTFAQKLTNPYSKDNRDLINRLFDQSAAAAGSASQQVEYRVSRAKFAHAVDDFPTEARLYQEILADESMRTVSLGSQDGTSSQQASALAETKIDELVRQAGAQVYAPYERAARDAMEFAKSAGKPDELLRVARKFPNASVASASMFAAAEQFESTGDNRQATQVLRQLYFKYPQATKTAVLEAMARNYLAIPGHADVAASRLAQGARFAADAKLAKPLKLPDGSVLQNVSFADAAAALRKLRNDDITRGLPEFKLPPAPPPGKASPRPFVQVDPILNVTALVPPLREFSRPDRAVVWTGDNQVALVAAGGSAQPLWLSKSLGEAPRECAWLPPVNAGGTPGLAVWNNNEIALLSGENGTLVWRAPLKTFPDVQVVKSDDPAATTPPAAAIDNGIAGGIWVNLNGRRVQIRQPMNGQLRIAGNLVINGNNVVLNGIPVQQAAAAPAVGPGGEQITAVRPAGDRLIAATNTGRLFAVDLATGRLDWQTRLTTDHAIERLLATDDFAVARFNDGSVIQIVALDAATGQVIRRYDNFRVDADVPVNQTLSPDGTLVIAMAGRLTAKDLYEPGPAAKWETPAQNNGSALFATADQPDQLLAGDGRVVVVSDTGSFVRVYSLDTGEPLRVKGEAGEVALQLPTGARAATPVHLRTAGPYLYVFGTGTIKAFDLDHPLDSSGGEGHRRIVDEEANLRDLFVGSDYLIALDSPGVARFIGNPDGPMTKARLLVYSRNLVDGRESGRLEYDPTYPDPAGITAWQPATAGLFYLSADNKLHFLKANSQ